MTRSYEEHLMHIMHMASVSIGMGCASDSCILLRPSDVRLEALQHSDLLLRALPMSPDLPNRQKQLHSSYWPIALLCSRRSPARPLVLAA